MSKIIGITVGTPFNPDKFGGGGSGGQDAFKEVVTPNVWELESGAYFVRGGFYWATPRPPVFPNFKEATSCFLFVSENENIGMQKDYYAIIGNDVYYGFSVENGINAETGEPFAEGECNKQEFGGTTGGGGVIDIVTTVNPAEGHTNEQVYGAKALDETFVTIDERLQEKQAELVSGENIKTINGQSILGEGDIAVEGSGSSKVFERITTVTVSPDEGGNLPTAISINKDNNGNPFELTDFYCDVLIGLTDGANGKIYIKAGKSFLIGALNPYFTTALRKWNCRYDSYGESNGGLFIAPNTTLSSGNFPNGNATTIVGQPVPVGHTVNVDSLDFVITTGTAKTFVEGTTITLWGVRK